MDLELSRIVIDDYHYKCKECELILEEAFQDCCGNRVCKPCKNKLLERPRIIICSTCNEERKFFKDRAADNQEVHCQYEGCDWKHPLKMLKAHHANCQYRQICCGGDCTVQLPPEEVEQHRSSCRKLHLYNGDCFSRRHNNLQEVGEAAEKLVQGLSSAIRTEVATVFSSLLSYQATASHGGLFRRIQGPLLTNGRQLWKIPLRAREESAVYSSPFYTHSNGYKMRLRLDHNGCEEGTNSHISLFLVLLAGEYDATLSWPLSVKVAFTLLNMARGENHVHVFKPRMFLRATGKEEMKAGYSQFIGRKFLRDYVKDDFIFINCEVKVVSA